MKTENIINIQLIWSCCILKEKQMVNVSCWWPVIQINSLSRDAACRIGCCRDFVFIINFMKLGYVQWWPSLATPAQLVLLEPEIILLSQSKRIKYCSVGSHLNIINISINWILSLKGSNIQNYQKEVSVRKATT